MLSCTARGTALVGLLRLERGGSPFCRIEREAATLMAATLAIAVDARRSEAAEFDEAAGRPDPDNAIAGVAPDAEVEALPGRPAGVGASTITT